MELNLNRHTYLYVGILLWELIEKLLKFNLDECSINIPIIFWLAFVLEVFFLPYLYLSWYCQLTDTVFSNKCSHSLHASCSYSLSLWNNLQLPLVVAAFSFPCSYSFQTSPLQSQLSVTLMIAAFNLPCGCTFHSPLRLHLLVTHVVVVFSHSFGGSF